MKLLSKMQSNWMDPILKDGNSKSREKGSINRAWRHEEDAAVEEEDAVAAAVADIMMVVAAEGVEEEEEDVVVAIVEAFGDVDEVVSEDVEAVDTIPIID